MSRQGLKPTDQIAVTDDPTTGSILISQLNPPAQLVLSYELAKGLESAIIKRDTVSPMFGRAWLQEPLMQLFWLKNFQIRPETSFILQIEYSSSSINITLPKRVAKEGSSPIKLLDPDQALRLISTISELIRHKEEVQNLPSDFLAEITFKG